MGQDTAELVIAGNGELYVADVGVTMPAKITEITIAGERQLSEDFTELGLTTESGVKFSDSKTIKDHRAWQLFYPAKKSITSRDCMAGYELEQWNAANFGLAFGGGEFSEDATGEYDYTPPDEAFIDERAHVAVWHDTDFDYAVLFPKGMVTNNVEANFTRENLATLPIVFSVIPATGELPWRFKTNNPAFAPAGS